MAASGLTSGNKALMKSAIALGNCGGSSAGYFFVVQSYWPPNVIQRNFEVRNWAIGNSLCKESSFGAKYTEVVFDALKNDLLEGEVAPLPEQALYGR